MKMIHLYVYIKWYVVALHVVIYLLLVTWCMSLVLLLSGFGYISFKVTRVIYLGIIRQHPKLQEPPEVSLFLDYSTPLYLLWQEGLTPSPLPRGSPHQRLLRQVLHESRQTALHPPYQLRRLNGFQSEVSYKFGRMPWVFQIPTGTKWLIVSSPMTIMYLFSRIHIHFKAMSTVMLV